MAVDLGDVVGLIFETRDTAGALANAGGVTVTIGLPDGTPVGPTTVPPTSVGRYQYEYPTVQAGRHTVRWVATGANASAHTDIFDVRPANPDYAVSLADIKLHLNIATTTTTHDEELRTYIEAATLVVERHTGRALIRRTYVEYHTVCRARTLVLDHCPVISLTSMQTVDGLTTWTVGNLHVDPTTGLVTVTAGALLDGHLQVTYVAGQTVLRANEVLAARIIVQHLWDTQRGSRGGPRAGGVDDTTMVAGYAVPNRALELLGPTPSVIA